MITIETVDERGKLLERFDDARVAHLLLEAAPDSSACLRFIDPYGDTVFNTLQLPILQQEIRALSDRLYDLPVRAQLQRLERFVEVAITKQPYVCLKLIVGNQTSVQTGVLSVPRNPRSKLGYN